MSEVDFSPKWPLQPQKPMMPNSQRRLSQRKGCGEERSDHAAWVTHAQSWKCREVAICAQKAGHPVIDADGGDPRERDRESPARSCWLLRQ